MRVCMFGCLKRARETGSEGVRAREREQQRERERELEIERASERAKAGEGEGVGEDDIVRGKDKERQAERERQNESESESGSKSGTERVGGKKKERNSGDASLGFDQISNLHMRASAQEKPFYFMLHCLYASCTFVSRQVEDLATNLHHAQHIARNCNTLQHAYAHSCVTSGGRRRHEPTTCMYLHCNTLQHTWKIYSQSTTGTTYCNTLHAY